ncbi:hypothetical protein KPH14_004927 [Odynerus spinipes]|uniref:Uncharacterized protein n=1 Tax=Odynerus spinipes TaxID=1348599 RepID=A0AAD9VPX5_9HYME|nr:hypothetical protein KPH14_004927 [Odynerus spinipes]
MESKEYTHCVQFRVNRIDRTIKVKNQSHYKCFIENLRNFSQCDSPHPCHPAFILTNPATIEITRFSDTVASTATLAMA